jgi:heme exporter protein D
VLTAAALVLARLWFFHYGNVFALGGYVWLVLVRDLLVVALFALALVRLRRPAAEDEDSVLLEHEPPLRVPS